MSSLVHKARENLRVLAVAYKVSTYKTSARLLVCAVNHARKDLPVSCMYHFMVQLRSPSLVRNI